jgi:hypothetical protein
MTLLTLQRNHNFGLLFHDSRLFSNMDPRQRATLFSLAYTETKENDLQYIASVSQNQLDSFQKLLSKDEFDAMNLPCLNFWESKWSLTTVDESCPLPY